MEAPGESSTGDNTETSSVHVELEREDTIAEAVVVVADYALTDDTPLADGGLKDEEAIEALVADEASALKGLTENVRDQEDLERDITSQANSMMIEQEDERDNKRIERVRTNLHKFETQLKTQKKRLNAFTNNPFMRTKCEEGIRRIEGEITSGEKDISDIQARITERHHHDGHSVQQEDSAGGNKRLPNESRRDFLIRTGKITPFSRMPVRGQRAENNDLGEALMDAEEEAEEAEQANAGAGEAEPRSHQNLRLPGFADAPDGGGISTPESEFSLRPRKKRKIGHDTATTSRHSRNASTDDDSADDFAPGDSEDGSEVFLEEEGDEGGALMTSRTAKRKASKATSVDEKVNLSNIDDGNENMYQARLDSWVGKRSAARHRKLDQNEASEEAVLSGNANEEEWFKPCPDAPDHHFENGIKLPGDIYPALFDYQKTGVQWLGELYSLSVGGIIGDEMGLGKTIQIISFLAGLHYSKKLRKPVIVVAPATVLRQWVNEFHKWWPPMRVSILHSSGSGMFNVGSEDRLEEAEEMYGRKIAKATKSSKAAKKIVDRVVRQGHVLVTTYAGLQTYSDILISVNWDYAVLDEGHKIRNPNAAITINCKELRTPNRIILSGTPMQNNLVELWSLFDFVFPMRLGTLVNFQQAFAIPVRLGGYSNATNLQVLTATKCAETLKATISPYLLQRLKVDVAADLPKKSEQVLFCKLTKPQRDAYEMFLSSDEMSSILNRNRRALYGIDICRKICNHPDLLDPRLRGRPGYKWGNANKSGKMQVVKALVEMWKSMGHKTLLFSQGVQMLNIIEDFIKGLDGFRYLRMDGSTNVKDRQTLVDQFNNDPDLHIFLLTTKVGGLGVNLTGANRVIIFDPDWNPSTDIQARERAWRLGQKKEVTIYRLMTAGTIEEKIYHRQIFKQFLTNKILKDPKQRQTFQMKDLHDLFTLGSTEDGTTETGQMFRGTEVQFHKDDSPSVDQAQVDPTSVDNDVLNVDGVAKLEAFRGDPADDKPASNEDRLMEGIFAKSGVHSALQHDEIINGKLKITADRGMIEREARKTAAEAAAQLRRAGEAARDVIPGIVTWTGEVGSSGRPANVRRGAGPNSSGVLSGLANRQALSTPGSASSSRSAAPAVAERAPRGKDFMKRIQTFIRTHGGSVPTQMLVNHFNRYCNTPQQTVDFKHMLDEIATLEQGNTYGRGKWVLKEGFK